VPATAGACVAGVTTGRRNCTDVARADHICRTVDPSSEASLGRSDTPALTGTACCESPLLPPPRHRGPHTGPAQSPDKRSR
jgi:hypothetical protein